MSAQYDYLADKYDTFMKATPFRPYIEAYTFSDVLGNVSGLRVVDLATGTGVYARAVAQMKAKEVVGIDLSKEMIALAQQAEADEPLGITYQVADASQFETVQPFDLAIAVYLLHYASTSEMLHMMCKNIASNVSTGGRFVTYMVNPQISNKPGYYEQYGLFIKTKPEYRNGEKVVVQLDLEGQFTPDIVFYRWDKETIDAALETAGFTAIEWIDPMLSPEWDGTKGDADFFDDYLSTPHALVIQCTKA